MNNNLISEESLQCLRNDDVNVQLEQSDIVKTLLEAGADVRACDDLALRYTPEKGEISRILDEAKKRKSSN